MLTPMTVADIAAHVGGSVEGDPDRPLTGLAAVEDAGPGDLTIVVDEKRARRLGDSSAAAALVPMDLALSTTQTALVRVENPRLALAVVAPLFVPGEMPEPGVAATADVHSDAVLGDRVSIGPGAVVGSRAVIGDDTQIGALTVVEAGATIGKACRIDPSCTIYGSVEMGDRVRLLAGVRLGTKGFGYTPGPSGLVRVPQIGRCIIGDDVGIGANTTIDRGTLGDTVIGAGTKIDNLVLIAHNCRIGRNCLIAGQSGLAGSVRIGDGALLGGGVGIADHVVVGEGARVGARSGVSRDIPPGATYFGYPARPRGEALRAAAAFLRLPGLFERLRALETAVYGDDE